MVENYVFVYGSLRKGMLNHQVLETIGVLYIGEYKTTNNYFMVGLKSKAYPYVVNEDINNNLVKGPIYGEVYAVSDEVLSHLDKLEGHPYSYTREIVNVNNEEQILRAYIYIVKNQEMINSIKENFGKRFVTVPGNNWKKYVES